VGVFLFCGFFIWVFRVMEQPVGFFVCGRLWWVFPVL
jgi:hypothetical protein